MSSSNPSDNCPIIWTQDAFTDVSYYSSGTASYPGKTVTTTTGTLGSPTWASAYMYGISPSGPTYVTSADVSKEIQGKLRMLQSAQTLDVLKWMVFDPPLELGTMGIDVNALVSSTTAVCAWCDRLAERGTPLQELYEPSPEFEHLRNVTIIEIDRLSKLCSPRLTLALTWPTKSGPPTWTLRTIPDLPPVPRTKPSEYVMPTLEKVAMATNVYKPFESDILKFIILPKLRTTLLTAQEAGKPIDSKADLWKAFQEKFSMKVSSSTFEEWLDKLDIKFTRSVRVTGLEPEPPMRMTGANWEISNPELGIRTLRQVQPDKPAKVAFDNEGLPESPSGGTLSPGGTGGSGQTLDLFGAIAGSDE